jgi:hypothetical protein
MSWVSFRNRERSRNSARRSRCARVSRIRKARDHVMYLLTLMLPSVYVQPGPIMTLSAPLSLYAHIFSQTKQNVELLISQKQISQNDGQDILNKLSAAFETPSSNKLVPSPILSRARALWGFNEAGQVRFRLFTSRLR